MDSNFFSFVWRYSKRQQTWIIFIVLLSFPIYFMALTLPKEIVNGPIQAQWFPEETSTVQLFELSTSFFGLFGDQTFQIFEGFEADRGDSLVALSILFLVLIGGNGAFRFYINMYKGQLGERMLRRLRYLLVDRLLRFPTDHYEKIRGAEVASMVKDEVEPLGGFIGDAFVQPIFLAGQALTVLAFIMLQNVWLGMIAAGIVITQALLIPRLRRRLLVFAKQRQVAARELSGNIGDLVSGAIEVRVHDVTNFERARISERLGELFYIRKDIFYYKFLVKYINNIISQLAPFLFFLVGGLYAISGELDVGQLVAVIVAYKDLPGPIKELINWDQQRMIAQLRYGQVAEQFDPKGMIPLEHQAPAAVPATALSGPYHLDRLAVASDDGAIVVDDVDFTIEASQQVALVSANLTHASAVARAFANIATVERGDIRAADASLLQATESIAGRRIAFVDEAAFLQAGSLRDCVLYSIRHALSQVDEPRTREEFETWISGNAPYSLDGDWFDYEALGVADAEDLERAVFEALHCVGMGEAVFDIGLSQPLGLNPDQELIDCIRDCRSKLRRKVSSDEFLREAVERFDPDRYQKQVEVADNLIFGAPLDRDTLFAQLARDPGFWALLRANQLDGRLYALGRDMARTVVELFADVPDDHPSFERLPFITPQLLPTLRKHLEAAGEPDQRAVQSDEGARSFLRLALNYVEPRHRFGLLKRSTRKSIIGARKAVRAYLESKHPGEVDFFDETALLPSMSVEENILFGRVIAQTAGAASQVRRQINAVVERVQAREVIARKGLDFDIGSGGRRLTAQQRQKISLARALLKRPNLLIVNNGLSKLDADDRVALVARVVEIGRSGWRGRSFASLWTMSDDALGAMFDRVARIEDGRLSAVEDVDAAARPAVDPSEKGAAGA